MEEKEFTARNVQAMTEEQLGLKGTVFKPSLGEGTCCSGQELVNQYCPVGHGKRMGRREGRSGFDVNFQSRP
jgi:hypothetical protein